MKTKDMVHQLQFKETFAICVACKIYSISLGIHRYTFK